MRPHRIFTDIAGRLLLALVLALVAGVIWGVVKVVEWLKG